MNRPLLGAGVLAALPVLGTGTVQELTFAPDEGTTLTLVYVTTRESELVAVEVEVQGEEQEVPPVENGPRIAVTERVVVTDEYAELDGDRPTLLRRSFDELSVDRTMGAPGAEEEQEFHDISELEGHTVTFAWDEDEEEYAVTDEDDELDEDFLGGLREDMSLRAFLPGDEVDEGDSWEVDIEAYAGLMWPGGEIGFHDEDEDERDANRKELSTGTRSALEGEVTATFEGIEEIDGVQVAVIALEVEATAEAAIDAEREDGGEERRVVAIERSLEGRLLWDVEAGRAHSLVLSGDAAETLTTERTISARDEDILFVQHLLFEGTMTYEVSIADEDSEEDE